MDKFDYWRSFDELSVVEAALLILGFDPNDYSNILKPISPPFPGPFDSAPPKLPECLPPPENFNTIFKALQSAIVRGRLSASTREKGEDPWDYAPGEDTVDWDQSTIMVEDLRKWLKSKNIATSFFFPETQPGPPYLDPENKYYAPKLAVAVKAWEAVTSDPRILNNGRKAKTNLVKWLTEKAEDFGLVHDDGELIESAIEQIASVANWDLKGGAPTTPGNK